MNYYRIPIWIVYRSPLIPCDIFCPSRGGYDLLLVTDQPIPKLQIKRMMKRGIDWLYITESSVPTYKSFVEQFLNDPSVPAWVLEVALEKHIEQLSFPEGTSIPQVVANVISEARANFDASMEKEKKSQSWSSHSAKATTEFIKSHTRPEGSAANWVKGTATENANSQLISSVKKLKDDLIMITQGGEVNLSSPQELASEIERLKRELSVSAKSGVLMERLSAINELLEDVSESENWMDCLSEIVDEMSVLELSLDESEDLVDTGVDIGSDELSELYTYKTRLEGEKKASIAERAALVEKNSKLQDENQRLKEELESMKRQYEKLHSEFDSEQQLANLPTAEMGKRMLQMESKMKELREVNVRQKMDVGKLISRNQETERKLKTKENQCKILHQKLNEALNKKRVG